MLGVLKLSLVTFVFALVCLMYYGVFFRCVYKHRKDMRNDDEAPILSNNDPHQVDNPFEE